MSEEEINAYFLLFTDAWKFFKKCVCLPYAEKEWEIANTECKELLEKHGNTELSKKLLIDAALLESELVVRKKYKESKGIGEKSE